MRFLYTRTNEVTMKIQGHSGRYYLNGSIGWNYDESIGKTMKRENKHWLLVLIFNKIRLLHNIRCG
jgi:hypothetical protein